MPSFWRTLTTACIQRNKHEPFGSKYIRVLLYKLVKKEICRDDKSPFAWRGFVLFLQLDLLADNGTSGRVELQVGDITTEKITIA